MTQVEDVRHTVITRKNRMEQNIIVQTVCGSGIIDIIVLICILVLCQLLKAQHKAGLISVFIAFHNGKGNECFTETYTIRQNTAVVFFKFIDNGKPGILLKIIEHAPNFVLLKASYFIRQNILRIIIKEFARDII